MPEGSAEETCWAPEHQGAPIPTFIVLCVLQLPPLSTEHVNTFINTSAPNINSPLQREEQDVFVFIQNTRVSLKLEELWIKQWSTSLVHKDARGYKLGQMYVDTQT